MNDFKMQKYENIYLFMKSRERCLTSQHFIAVEIKSRLRSGNACYHSVRNLLSLRLLSKNLKIKIYIYIYIYIEV